MKSNIGGSLYQRPKSKYFWAKYYVPGQEEPIRESTGETEEKKATNFLKKRLGEVATQGFVAQARATRVNALLDLVVQDQELRQRKGIAKVKSRMHHLRGFFGELRVTSVGNAEMTAYIAKRRGEKPKTGRGLTKNATINRELEILRRAYTLGFYHEPQLVTKILRVPRLREDNVRQGFLSHEDYVRLREALPQHYRLLLICGYHLGTRLGELVKVQWSQVDLEAREILIHREDTKNDRARILPIYGEMIEALRQEKEYQEQRYPECPYVFQRWGRQLIYRWATFNDLVAKAGVKNFTFHDLRRTAVTNMIENGIPEKDAMEISGHTTRKMLERYHIIKRDTIQRVGAKMTEVFAGKEAALSMEAHA